MFTLIQNATSCNSKDGSIHRYYFNYCSLHGCYTYVSIDLTWFSSGVSFQPLYKSLGSFCKSLKSQTVILALVIFIYYILADFLQVYRFELEGWGLVVLLWNLYLRFRNLHKKDAPDEDPKLHQPKGCLITMKIVSRIIQIINHDYQNFKTLTTYLFSWKLIVIIIVYTSVSQAGFYEVLGFLKSLLKGSFKRYW